MIMIIIKASMNSAVPYITLQLSSVDVSDSGDHKRPRIAT